MDSKRWVLISAGCLGLLAILVTAGIIWVRLTKPHYLIPPSISEQVLFKTYMPTVLPEGYTVMEKSYRVQDKVLLFTVQSDDGQKIYFAEEALPKNFDLTAFYQQQLNGIKNLQHVPYPSVMGRLNSGDRLLSISTGQTWLLITAKTASEDDLRLIAEHMRAQ